MTNRPNIIILFPDDLGWGQTGYNGHPVVSTPNIDALAANGLRFDRFYSNCACSPTRANILTGRAGHRTGVHRQFYRLRLQERTVAHALKKGAYRTGLFGKWHLSGLRGSPGAPVLLQDTHGPDKFGFDEFFANTCNIDLQTLMGDHTGAITETPADSSSAISDKTNAFIDASVQAGQPFFAHVCFSAPHAPFQALPANKALFEGMGFTPDQENLYGMIVELDNAIGSIRQKLRDLNIEKDTLVWFVSDNGGVHTVDPHASGSLRGGKPTIYEGGARTLCAVEWEGRIQPGVTKYLGHTGDIPSTLCDIVGVNSRRLVQPQDGISLKKLLFEGEEPVAERGIPIESWDQDRRGQGALITDRWKILTHAVRGTAEWELYDLQEDEAEANDLASNYPDIVADLAKHFWAWHGQVRASVNGVDYPEGQVIGQFPLATHFFNDPMYADYVNDWKLRPEYANPYALSMIPDQPGDLFYEPFYF